MQNKGILKALKWFFTYLLKEMYSGIILNLKCKNKSLAFWLVSLQYWESNQHTRANSYPAYEPYVKFSKVTFTQRSSNVIQEQLWNGDHSQCTEYWFTVCRHRKPKLSETSVTQNYLQLFTLAFLTTFLYSLWASQYDF